MKQQTQWNQNSNMKQQTQAPAAAQTEPRQRSGSRWGGGAFVGFGFPGFDRRVCWIWFCKFWLARLLGLAMVLLVKTCEEFDGKIQYYEKLKVRVRHCTGVNFVFFFFFEELKSLILDFQLPTHGNRVCKTQVAIMNSSLRDSRC